MNVTWLYHRRVDGIWGNILPNGSFDGIISSLTKGDADIGTCSLSMMAHRYGPVYTTDRPKKWIFVPLCVWSV